MQAIDTIHSLGTSGAAWRKALGGPGIKKTQKKMANLRTDSVIGKIHRTIKLLINNLGKERST
jgi:hypothetical protein